MTDYRRTLAACVRMGNPGTFLLLQRDSGLWYARVYVGPAGAHALGTGPTVGAALAALRAHAGKVRAEHRRGARTLFGEFAASIPEPGSSVLAVAARTLGQRGGMKGGPARAAALKPARRAAIARKAAKAPMGQTKKVT